MALNAQPPTAANAPVTSSNSTAPGTNAINATYATTIPPTTLNVPTTTSALTTSINATYTTTALPTTTTNSLSASTTTLNAITIAPATTTANSTTTVFVNSTTTFQMTTANATTTTINAVTTVQPTTTANTLTTTMPANLTSESSNRSFQHGASQQYGSGAFNSVPIRIIGRLNSGGRAMVYLANRSANGFSVNNPPTNEPNFTSSLSAISLSYGQMSNLTSINASTLQSAVHELRNYTKNGTKLSFFNETFNVSYGSISQSSEYVNANSTLHFLAYDQQQTLTQYNVHVQKAQPSLVLYIDGARISNPGNYTIRPPVLPGHTTYNLNISMVSSLIGRNIGRYTYYVKLTNGTVLVPNTTINASAILQKFNYVLPVSVGASIRFDFGGNSNYTQMDPNANVLPSNIIYYVPITFTNSQSVKVSDPFQLSVTINSLAYQSYEASNLDNVEFFYTNGTLVPSWLEGNVLNSAQTANLYTSENTVYWLSVVGNFLPASSSNTLFMGFSANTLNLFDGVTTGESPQLSVTYANYDDGASVFTYYNTNPSSTSGWTITGTAGHTATAPSGNHYSTTNALYANSASGDYMRTTIPSLSTNEIISFDVYTTGLGDLFFLTSSTGSGQMARLDGRGGSDYSGIANAATWTSWSAPTGISEAKNVWYKYDIVISGSSATSYIGSVSDALGALGTTANSKSISNNGNYIGLVGDGLGSSYITYWDGLVIRKYPPSGIMPTAVFNSIVSSGTPVLLIPTNPLVQGQSDVITAIASPNTDTIEILVNGVVRAGPATGTVTYNADTLTAGTYTVNALDTFSSKSTSEVLVVGNLPSLSIPTNPLVQGQSDIISAAANPNTDNVELLVNGATVAGPATGTVTYNANILSIGTYTITATDTATSISTSQSLGIKCAAPLSSPFGVGNFVCIGLVNSNSIAVPSPFQQMVTINSLAYHSYEASNLMNVVFFNYSGNVINSWMESEPSNTATNTVYWLKVTNSLLGNAPSPNSIPADSNTFVYMGFASLSTNLLNTQTTGEAPQLSSAYGQYDDGPSVFTYYNASPYSTTGWTIAGAAGLTSSAPSGSYFATTNAYTANGANGDYMYTSLSNLSENEIITYWEYTTDLGNLYFLTDSTGSGQMSRLGCGPGWYGIASSSSWTLWTAPPGTGPACSIWYKVDVTIIGSTATAYYNASSNLIAVYGSNPSNQYTISLNGIYFGLVGDAGGGTTVTYWNGFVIRAYPPGGAMPAANAGPVQQVAANICYFTPSNTLINFPSTSPGSTSSANIITFVDNVGNTPTNVLIQGTLPQGNWISSSPSGHSFYLSNTLWGMTSATATTPLTTAASDTGVYVPSGGVGANSIWVAARIPDSQTAATYNSVITVLSSC